MSQSPAQVSDFEFESEYADAARQLNKLVRAGRSYSGHERNCCYLNTGTGQFANASIVSGFDFPEDGRAVAICDWDGDGDQDFWVSNRTAPQVRFMQNQLTNQQQHSNYVSFRLVGTDSNRSAIGASVQITTDGSSTLRKTVRAGEGFLACSSKRVHFGIGEATKIAEVRVRWPSGKKESFGPLPSVNGQLELKENTGQPRAIARPIHKLVPTQTQPPIQTFATHNWLNEPLPCPPIAYQDPDGQTIDASVATGKPTVINLWATWCQPCIEELTDWSASHESFQNRNVRLLALCTDAIDGSGTDGSDVLTRLNFKGEYGEATPALIDTLQHLQNTIYDHHRPLPVPTTVLVDGEGNLRGFYKGPVSVDKLCEDIDHLSNDAERLPFAGTWLATQGTHDVRLFVEELFRDGYQVEATAFVERLTAPRFLPRQIKARLFLAQEQSRDEKVEALRQLFAVLKVEPNNPSAHEQMGLLMARAGRSKEAIHHFEQAVSNSINPSARTLFNYAKSLRASNLLDAAIQNFDRAIRAEPTFAPAFEQRGFIHATKGDFQQAASDFDKAIELEPKMVRHRVNAAMALGQLRRFDEGWTYIQPVVAGKSPPKPAVMLGAQLLQELDKPREAAELIERYLMLDPGADDVRKLLEELQNP